ncbi:MAG TPA: PocR ligand-binding domain-containing protein [Geobacteraceae bacterium]
MSRLTFPQLVDLEKIRQLLEAHFKITGMLSAILDTEENVLVAVGWQDICSRFHRANPQTCARCRESDAYIKSHLTDFDGEYLEYRCRNGLRDVAVPIFIGGEHLATFFTGQFFYTDDKPDEEYFRAQAREFGFVEADYMAALSRVQVHTREQVKSFMEFSRCLVQMIAEMGLNNLELSREVAIRTKAEKESQESRDYLERIIDTIADPIFVKDREHRLLLVNAAECELAGRSREEMIGRTDYEFFPKKQVDVFWEKDEIVFRTGEENINEEEITDAHGEKRVIVTKKALYEDRGGARYIVGVIRDITEIKRVEEEVRKLNAELEQRVAERTGQLVAANEQLQTEIAGRKRMFDELQLTQFFVDKASIGIFRISEEGSIIFVNELACLSLGYSPEELCSLTIFDIDPTFNRERFQEHRRALRAAGFRTFETTHRRKDGSTFPVEITVNYMEYRGKGFTVSFAKDISKRKLAEEQLKQKKQQLEELNRDLRKRVKTEVANNREKDIILIQQNRQAVLGEALEHIVHQWKQPINTIGILAQYLESYYSAGGLTCGIVHETVAKIMELLGHMSQTADLFRDFYKPEKEKKAFGIREAVIEALSFIEPAFRHQRVAVEIDAEPGVAAFGYPKEFAQVLLIILTNARDAFKERKTEKAQLAIRAVAEGKKGVVTITDNAGGIPERALGRVFDLYFTTREANGGTGIGLYMAKSIIEKHMKGKLSVTNVAGGACFRIEISAPKQD